MTIYTAKITVLLDLYAYHHLSELLGNEVNDNIAFLLSSLKERRELNIAFLFDREEERKRCEAYFNYELLANDYDKELLANYIFDLEAKLRNDKVIDFVRAVSPILYRLFLTVLSEQVPELEKYIHNAKSSRYDTWNFHKMHASDNPTIKSYVSKKRDARVTSSSLSELIQHSQLEQHIKQTVSDLRDFERSVRNPLAHLIQPFDEMELFRTTGFSSQSFIEKIIDLALYCGVSYNRDSFYFDEMNALLLKALKND